MVSKSSVEIEIQKSFIVIVYNQPFLKLVQKWLPHIKIQLFIALKQNNIEFSIYNKTSKYKFSLQNNRACSNSKRTQRHLKTISSLQFLLLSTLL